MKKYLQTTEIIDYYDKSIQDLAKTLAQNTEDDTHIAKNCYTYARDKIQHSGDFKNNTTTTFKASDVLRHKTGWCYAKSHLLAALLRANNILTGFCYQRLGSSEYKPNIYCLHGLNWIYLKEHGWHKADTQFTPPYLQLAFKLKKYEFDLNENLAEPLDTVLAALKKYKSYDDMIYHFPDLSRKDIG